MARPADGRCFPWATFWPDRCDPDLVAAVEWGIGDGQRVLSSNRVAGYDPDHTRADRTPGKPRVTNDVIAGQSPFQRE